ncbi:hypothetical protein BH24GEM3_BH24GEM3_13500 [soil metagenome]
MVVPLERRHSWDEVRDFSHALAEKLVRRSSARYVAQAAKVERSGKIYVDYLRNAWGASAVAAYSTRARSGAPVSTPLRWEELGPTRPETFTLKELPARLTALEEDPWAGYTSVRQRITRAMREAVKA